MLPSSYVRRLRTRELLNRNFPHSDTISRDSTKKSSGRVDFSGSLFTHAYLPYLHRQKTQIRTATKVSGQIDIVLAKLAEERERVQRQESELYQKKLTAATMLSYRDTPVPELKIKTPRKNTGPKSRLDAISEKSVSVTPTAKAISVTPVSLENLTMETVISLFKTLMKDRNFSRAFRRNSLRLEVQNPIVCQGIPAWSQEFKTEVNAFVPIKSIRYAKYKITKVEDGYIQVDLPKKIPRIRNDVYGELRSDEETKLSTSALNKGMYQVFSESLEAVKFDENGITPELRFDYLSESIELVYTKQFKIPIIPAIVLPNDDTLYVLRPNFPDLNPTSDTLWRACYLIEEEKILSKICTTDKGMRLEALRVIHRLCQQDWRLKLLTVYQLKNILMHDVDFEIDHSPRWQRITRDACVQSLTKRLLYFVQKKELPLFFNSNIDLFKNISEKYLTFMKTPLERLVGNEDQLLRDLQRAARNDEQTSSSSDDDW